MAESTDHQIGRITEAIDNLKSMAGPRADWRETWERVKSNHAKLDGCARHNFEKMEGTLPRYRCLNCGGDIDGVNYLWYQRGIEHATTIS